MEIWLIWIIVGIVFFILELFTPILFFLNLAFACLLSALAAYYDFAIGWQIGIFAIFSTLLLIFIRPLLMKNIATKETETGVDAKYIGQTAKTILPTNSTDGRITIYGEDWKAISLNGEEIPTDTPVKIVKNEGTIFYVEKI